jgi:phage tail sheath protein FI
MSRLNWQRLRRAWSSSHPSARAGGSSPPIFGASTSTTAFVGRARNGPVSEPTVIHALADYDRVFGGLWNESRMGFAVRQYFENGGQDAVIVRVTREAEPKAACSTWKLPGATGDLELEARNPGAWGNKVTVSVDHDSVDPNSRFNLTVVDTETGETETLRNLAVDADAPTFVTAVLQQYSRFIRVAQGSTVPAGTPADLPAAVGTGGDDGGDIRSQDVMPSNGRRGVRALGAVDLFNLLCLPPLSMETDIDPVTYRDAVAYLREARRRAMVIVDPPASAIDPNAAQLFQSSLNLASDQAAFYFPRLRAPNPLNEEQIEDFAPCGAVAGVFARTDAQRGVWKAPAGTEARIAGTSGLTYLVSDRESGDLNPLGINSIRNVPSIGTVLWGARTLRGADAFASEWKYIPVRRVAFFIEESLIQGLGWVALEPNGVRLWEQIRDSVGQFMIGLFRQGAFQGTVPAQAYFVKCDAETTSSDDIDRGVVNIVVGFAPLKPGEFVVLKIQQVAAQV